jgi:hypothetical protein
MSYSSVTFGGGVDEAGDPDYVYYNALIINNRTEPTVDTPDPVIRYQDTRQQPIIRDASKYHFSIIRANINGPNKDLPLFIPTIRTGAVENPTQDVNLTIYDITISITFNYVVGGNPFAFTATSRQPLIWNTETTDIAQAPVPLPSTTVTGQDVDSRYYWAYTYSHVLQLVNAAYAAAIADINTQFQANYTAVGGWNLPGPAPAILTDPPFMTYNPQSNLFTLYADRQGFGGSAATTFGTNTQEQATLWFNGPMFGLFSNFNNTYENLSGGRTNRILIYPIGYQNILNVASPPAPKAISYWIMNQDYPSTSSLWNPCESIVFTSTMMPLVFEQVGPPVAFGDSELGQTGNIAAAFSPIITDIALTNESASDYRQFIQYIPSAEYRLTAFQRSKSEIYNVDVQVFWKNRLNGRLYPLQMFNGSSVSVKMMFRRRGAENYPHQ